jgi:hypothetical protein
MKNLYRIVGIVMVLMTCISSVCAQSEAVSPRLSFNMPKVVKPPVFKILEGPDFMDADGNRAIDAKEACKIVMKIENVGYGEGKGLLARISAEGATKGITFTAEKKMPDIPVGSTATIEYPIHTDMNTVDGTVTFRVSVYEPNGFNIPEYPVVVETRKFQEPLLVVNEYKVSSENGKKNEVLEKQKAFVLQVLIQNMGKGVAEEVQVELEHPVGVYVFSGNENQTYPQWKAGASQIIDYNLIVNQLYEKNDLLFKVKISEKYGRYAHDTVITLKLNQQLASSPIVVEAQITEFEIESATLSSDVDKNIPKTDNRYPNRFAIIIGNEDYQSRQKSLKKEQNVPYAVVDAEVFKEYCVKTLGIDNDNIAFMTNATSAEMWRGIYKIVGLVKNRMRDEQDAEIVFYYAGHGLPENITNIPYLIPVDVNAGNLGNAIPLYGLCKELSDTRAKRVTVFLDACFSGGARDESLLADNRAMDVTPQQRALSGNVVIFSATTATQSALPYDKGKHGMFTYFLLKKLQDSQGQCSYSQLYEDLVKEVSDKSIREKDQQQDPTVQASPGAEADNWRNWTFQDN